MVVLSKLTTTPTVLARTLGMLRANELAAIQQRFSHAALFRKRPAQLIVNRIKDVTHFYFIGIGFLPVLACLVYNHIVHGACELKDYPEGNSPPPHYWQFERTPVRQWWAKHFGVSDIEHHERQLAYYERLAVIARWRQIEQRVKHLEGERWDYKAWTYQPISATWIDYGRWHAQRIRNQYEQHGHYGY